MEAFLDEIYGPITDYFENDYYLAAAKLLEVLLQLTFNPTSEWGFSGLYFLECFLHGIPHPINDKDQIEVELFSWKTTSNKDQLEVCLPKSSLLSGLIGMSFSMEISLDLCLGGVIGCSSYILHLKYFLELSMNN